MAQWGRVSRSNPCKICGKADYCSFSLDGEVAKCCRVCSEKKVSSKNGVGEGWIHRFTNPVAIRVEVEKPKRHTRRKLREMANEMHEEGLSRLPWLAGNLGVSVESLIALKAGWRRGAYSFPEVDGNGKTVGISYRTESGRKFSEKGGSRGIYTSRGRFPGQYAFVVEGASDMAACYTAGLNALGRPTASGGVDYLATTLLRDFAGYAVIVVGENDKKAKESREVWPCGYCGACPLCWPGLAGARTTVAGLLEAGVTAQMAMPRSGKDCRDILRKTGGISMDDFDVEGNVQGFFRLCF